MELEFAPPLGVRDVDATTEVRNQHQGLSDVPGGRMI